MNTNTPILVDTGKIGNAGHVVIPLELRKKYGLDKGNHITWFDTGEVMIIKPMKPEITLSAKEPNEFEIALQNAGLTLAQWEEGRKVAARKLLKEMYGLDYDTLANA